MKNLKSKIEVLAKGLARRKSKKNKGFSIIELVFAMCFLTLIILGVVSLQSANLAMINRQNNQIQAQFYANQGIQVLRAIGYTDIKSKLDGISGCDVLCKTKFRFNTNIKPYELIAHGGQDEAITDSIFRRYVETDSTNLQNAYKATVYVGWDDSTGKHTVSAKSIIF